MYHTMATTSASATLVRLYPASSSSAVRTSRRSTPRRATTTTTTRVTASAAGTMSAPMKVSEAAKLAPSVAVPAHPTYSIADAIKLALEEDIADVGDISSLST